MVPSPITDRLSDLQKVLGKNKRQKEEGAKNKDPLDDSDIDYEEFIREQIQEQMRIEKQ